MSLKDKSVIKHKHKCFFHNIRLRRVFSLELFKTAGLCKSQWVRDALWWRYPTLRRIAPTLSGYTWQTNIIKKEYETLEKIVDLHRDKPGMLFSNVMNSATCSSNIAMA